MPGPRPSPASSVIRTQFCALPLPTTPESAKVKGFRLLGGRVRPFTLADSGVINLHRDDQEVKMSVGGRGPLGPAGKTVVGRNRGRVRDEDGSLHPNQYGRTQGSAPPVRWALESRLVRAILSPGPVCCSCRWILTLPRSAAAASLPPPAPASATRRSSFWRRVCVARDWRRSSPRRRPGRRPRPRRSPRPLRVRTCR